MDDQTKATDNAGHRLRVRERFKKSLGADMADYELLEFILTYSIPRRDVKPIAKALLRRFGNLGEVLSASPEELSEISWVKDSTILLLKGIGAVWQRISRLKLEENPRIALLSPDAVVDYCYANMAFADVFHRFVDLVRRSWRHPHRGECFNLWLGVFLDAERLYQAQQKSRNRLIISDSPIREPHLGHLSEICHR